ncbi:hypothetical protein GDO81_014659 [Engystomops pustulosus]|uniref:Secreted protein n=1 Tax=Engystomops pustulosus TaxID=76066 RepID=A0AAV7BBZ2_ENGPU|nr:hypothetical protein GDO81_014659 [Engystomops pustulosus]
MDGSPLSCCTVSAGTCGTTAFLFRSAAGICGCSCVFPFWNEKLAGFNTWGDTLWGASGGTGPACATGARGPGLQICFCWAKRSLFL